MRTNFIWMAFASALILMLGLQFFAPSNEALAISATVSIEPETLYLKEKGRWITVYVELPEPYSVGDVDVSSIMLDGKIPAEWAGVEGETLVAKFDASVVIDYIWTTTLYHMGINYMDIIRPQESVEVELKVTCKFLDGITAFEGIDTVEVMNP